MKSWTSMLGDIYIGFRIARYALSRINVDGDIC